MGIRTIIVPPDIVPVRRTSPVRVKKRTPWHPHPEGDSTQRGGTREWFSDQIFADSQQPHIRAACGTSMAAHVSGLVVVIIVLVTRPYEPPLVRVGPELVMPILMTTLPDAPPPPNPAPRAVERTALAPAPPPPPVAALAAAATPPAPIEAPSSIEPETGAEGGMEGVEDGIEGGVPGGASGGVVGGLLGGTSSPGPVSRGPVRLAAGIEPPRKIKDVRPVYPQGALSDQARGTVVIEAVVDTDGKVSDAKVIQSVPLLDQSALDAVRQWEFVPSRLNGVPVAVIITVIVQFAIH
jgi:protein TonB